MVETHVLLVAPVALVGDVKVMPLLMQIHLRREIVIIL
jgi:hypothetical protein